MKRLLIIVLCIATTLIFSSKGMEHGLTEKQCYNQIANRVKREHKKNLKVEESRKKLWQEGILNDRGYFQRDYKVDSSIGCCCYSCIAATLGAIVFCRLYFFQ